MLGINNNINNGSFINNPAYKHSTPCKEPNNNHRKMEENNEHKISKKGVSVNRSIGQDGDSFEKMGYCRIIRKPDRLA